MCTCIVTSWIMLVTTFEDKVSQVYKIKHICASMVYNLFYGRYKTIDVKQMFLPDVQTLRPNLTSNSFFMRIVRARDVIKIFLHKQMPDMWDGWMNTLLWANSFVQDSIGNVLGLELVLHGENLTMGQYHVDAGFIFGKYKKWIGLSSYTRDMGRRQ